MGTVKKPASDAARTLTQLNEFLGSELAAVETYKLALDNLEHPSKARTSLESCLQSHQQRVSLLKSAVAQHGGVPAQGSGAWAKLVQVVEGLADDIGDKATVAALELGEDHDLAAYQRDLAGLDDSARTLVEMQLLPKQQQTQHQISELRKLLH